MHILDSEIPIIQGSFSCKQPRLKKQWKISLGNLFTSFTYSTFVTINNETLSCNEINRFIIYETFDLKINLNFILTMPFANPFGKYGDGKYVGIPRAEWFKRPEIKSIFKIRFIGRYYI